MSKATVQPGQTLTDIAVQYLGSEEGVFALASLNSLGVTAFLPAGQELELPAVVDKRVRRIMVDGLYLPASNSPDDQSTINFSPMEVALPFEYNDRRAVVAPGQSLVDISIQYLGSEEAVYELAQLNEINVNATLTAGQVLQLPSVVNTKVVAYFTDGEYYPASDTIEEIEGISVWAINVNFIVTEDG